MQRKKSFFFSFLSESTFGQWPKARENRQKAKENIIFSRATDRGKGASHAENMALQIINIYSPPHLLILRKKVVTL
jgi:hypothetical protein